LALFYQPDLALLHLTPEESHHAVRVLRMRIDDTLELTDGKGTWCQAALTSTDERKAAYRITTTTKVAKRPFSIHLAIAPTKNIDRMEWMVEKCVEIGIEKITFVRCKTSERPTVPIERLIKLTISAMKQSKQAWLPMVNDVIAFQDLFEQLNEEQRFVAHVDESNPNHLSNVARTGGSYALLVGPEGDFTSEELSLAALSGFQKVSLGPNRLRTETAGLYGVMALQLVNK
jgi:16S rRNA (uracil1498-N3)-methyltransferase